MPSAPKMPELKRLLPRGAEYLADISFELTTGTGIHPLTILAITGHESRYGLALQPPGPEGTGDFLPRFATPARDAHMAKYPMPGCVRKLATWQVPDGKGGKETRSGMAWVPASEGWGHGLYQIDWMSHAPFLSTGKWKDPREAVRYALTLLSSARAQILGAFPALAGMGLWRATVASYNAGAGAVIKALRAGAKPEQLDQGASLQAGGTRVTFSPGYVSGIEKTVAAFGNAAYGADIRDSL